MLEPKYKPYNRYRDILPYPETRVKITPAPHNDHIDYINANYVPGYSGVRFICAQGPLPHTAKHFWQMVWEQNASLIVMVTRFVEARRPKCDVYIPSRMVPRDRDPDDSDDDTEEEEVETFGAFRVRLLEEEDHGAYVTRSLQLMHDGECVSVSAVLTSHV